VFPARLRVLVELIGIVVPPPGFGQLWVDPQGTGLVAFVVVAIIGPVVSDPLVNENFGA
jgi:hypothetical protein